MDEGLFKKYTTQLQKRGASKKNILNLITLETGVTLHEEDIEISKKQVKITTTSTIRQKLFQKNIKKILQEKGYTLQ